MQRYNSYKNLNEVLNNINNGNNANSLNIASNNANNANNDYNLNNVASNATSNANNTNIAINNANITNGSRGSIFKSSIFSDLLNKDSQVKEAQKTVFAKERKSKQVINQLITIYLFYYDFSFILPT